MSADDLRNGFVTRKLQWPGLRTSPKCLRQSPGTKEPKALSHLTSDIHMIDSTMVLLNCQRNPMTGTYRVHIGSRVLIAHRTRMPPHRRKTPSPKVWMKGTNDDHIGRCPPTTHLGRSPRVHKIC